MRCSDYSTQLQLSNKSLRTKIQKQRQQLIRVIGISLDLSQPQYSQEVFPQLQNKKWNETDRKKLQTLIKKQMTKLAVLSSQYDMSLVKISQKLINSQLLQQKSAQMKSVSIKYQQALTQYRNHLIQKQNQLYYTIKTMQVFQDQYFNCTPSKQRIKEVHPTFLKKNIILKQCINYINEVNEILVSISNLKENEQKQKQLKTLQQIQSQINEQSWVEEYKQNFVRTQHKAPKQIRNKQIKQITIQNKQESTTLQYPPKNLFKSQRPHISEQRSWIQANLQQNTQFQFRKARTFTGQLEMESQIPNFRLMSRHNYELFKIYQQKITRQSTKYENLIEQYENYVKIYKLLQQQNIKLLKQVIKQKEESQAPIQLSPNSMQNIQQKSNEASEINSDQLLNDQKIGDQAYVQDVMTKRRASRQLFNQFLDTLNSQDHKPDSNNINQIVKQRELVFSSAPY